MNCVHCPMGNAACHGPLLPHLCDWAASGDVGSVVGRNAFPPPQASVLELPPVFARAHDLVIRTYLNSWTGYGRLAEGLGRGLDEQGIAVGYAGIGPAARSATLQGFVAQRSGAPTDQGKPLLQLATPQTALLAPGAVVFTMWETSRISAAAVAQLNTARAVIVPSAYNVEGFRASGVTVPLHVVPLGVAACDGYVPQPWAQAGPLTFGMAARMTAGDDRKGINEGVDAWAAAFPHGEDVRLVIKVDENCVPAPRRPADPRIEIVTTPFTPAQMAAWYGTIDCLFVPSRGEGWGLHTQQAMSCGRPVVAADHSGTRAFWTPACGWSLPFELAPAGAFYPGGGVWATPSPEGMIAALRAAFQAGRAGGQERGMIAAQRAAEFTWERTGRETAQLLRQLGVVATSSGPPPATAAVAHEAGRQRAAACDHRTRLNCCSGRCRAQGGKVVLTSECAVCPLWESTAF
jgi:glycosyltransferase involved in cell wall biosynthesis